MAENFILGFNAKAYLSTTLLDGTNTAAILAAATELTNIRDATIDGSKGEADIATRATGGWEARAGVLKDGTLEFSMLWLPNNANFEAIKDAWLAEEGEIALFFLDQANDVQGSQGLAANFSILNFTVNQPLREASTVDVSASISSFPEWYEVP